MVRAASLVPALAALARAADRTEEVASRLEGALLARIRVRVEEEVVPPGSMARTEMGKVQRVFEQTNDRDPLG